MGNLSEGGAVAELNVVASHSSAFAEQNPSEIGKDNWAIAERAAHEIIRKVQPNSVSEERRTKVVDYIQRLIRNCLGAEVFPYGSVPLKTYLPDGDVDLTTFGGAHFEDALADDMKTILEEEGKNASAKLVVKDVQLVRAEVKLVKCIVEDVVVDISFNQIGGLCTLCFLEQVDLLIGKDHLFKRSIILIKAWCYYESRILGAHHGLISTYALEIMVLYIFHHFHSKLDGPLAVLYKFLDYFSKFDWETYSISLGGPVRLSMLPAITVEMADDSDRELLLQSDLLSLCTNMFSVPSNRGGDKSSRGFQLKHFNIFDPLKDFNNLGRSVSKGNYYRIRSAFSYGARKLTGILFQPVQSIANELHLFFSNTMTRHGGERAPDINQLLICNGPISILPIPGSGDSKPTSGDNTWPDIANESARSVAPQNPNSDQSEKSEKVDSKSLDLSGDFETSLRCLHYGRWCYETGLGMRSLLLRATPFQNNWDRVLPLTHYKPHGSPYPPRNGFHPNPTLYGVQPVILPAVTFGPEDVPKGLKPRGTGTYFPNTNQQLPQGYNMKGKNHAPSKWVRNNGRNVVLPEPNILERSSHELSQQYSPRMSYEYPDPNGEGVVDLDLVEHAHATSVSEKMSRQKPPISSSPRTLSGIRMSESSLSTEQDRTLLGSSYRLKDEDDFPPLPLCES